MNKFVYTIFAVLFLYLSGCAGTSVLSRDVGEGDNNANGDVDVTALDEDCKQPCTFPRSALENSESVLAARIIFFEYDSAEIKPEYQELLIAHGQYLKSYTDVKVRLEGHTDERGSREFNLALGEERAKSVRRILLLQGVADENINVVSFGEELPMDFGHDEPAWKQNRRVELVYED